VPPGARVFRDQTGVTGLETAIILIAFVVVASVFAFTVLSTGIFSAERGKETVRTAHITGLAAWEDTPGIVNLSNQTQLKLWIRSSTTTVDGQLEIVLDEDAACLSPEAEIQIPALAANAWTLVTAVITELDGITPVANLSKDQIVCVGPDVENDLSTTGDVDINLDQIVGAGEITQLVFNVAGVQRSEPIFVQAPSDADGDGLADADRKRGGGSADFVIQTAATTGLMAYEDRVSGVDLTDQTQLKF
jgi:hypothetical protein